MHSIAVGCGIKGDTDKIIMEKEGIGFREAIKVGRRNHWAEQ